MRSWSIAAGRIWGVEIRIHLTFLFLLVFVWMTESAARGSAGPVRGLGLVGIIFGCVVLHELGHAMVGHNEGMGLKGVLRHTHPEMPSHANASVSWDTSDLIDETGRKFKVEKIPSILRMLMGGAAADEHAGRPAGRA